MLRAVHTQEVMAVEVPAAQARPHSRVLRARSIDDLRVGVPSLLGPLFRRGVRIELFVHAGERGLLPVLHGAEPEARASRVVLVTARRELLARGRRFAEPQALRADETAGRCPVLTAPVTGPEGSLLGLLLVEGAPRHPDFTATELAALEAVAALISVPLQHLEQRHAGRAARLDLDREAATRLQRGFMSCALPPNAGLTAQAEYLPAFDVGGDFYGVRRHHDGAVSVTIGDVSGNGIPAALLMSRVASDLERELEAGVAPSAALGSVNERLLRLETERFVTAVCARVDAARRRLSVASAGHVPLVLRRASGDVFTFGGATGMPLGMVAGDYATEELVLEPDNIVLLLTDGLLEALDYPSGHHGMAIVLDIVRAAPHDAGAVSARLRTEVELARREHALDDVTWLVLQVGAAT